MNEKVEAYIRYLRTHIKERPQCLMFAMLMKLKFSSAVILHGAPGHCITEIDGKYYDWDGVAKRTEGFVRFPERYGNSHIVGHYYAIKERFLSEA